MAWETWFKERYESPVSKIVYCSLYFFGVLAYVRDQNVYVVAGFGVQIVFKIVGADWRQAMPLTTGSGISAPTALSLQWSARNISLTNKFELSGDCG